MHLLKIAMEITKISHFYSLSAGLDILNWKARPCGSNERKWRNSIYRICHFFPLFSYKCLVTWRIIHVQIYQVSFTHTQKKKMWIIKTAFVHIKFFINQISDFRDKRWVPLHDTFDCLKELLFGHILRVLWLTIFNLN